MRSFLTTRILKAALLAHIVFSVGWLGAIVPFLALAVVGVMSPDAIVVRSTYIAMAIVGWYVIVPFSVAALATGFVQSVISEWGLLRHYWVVIKGLLTIAATALLPLHLQVASRLSAAATERTLGPDDLRGLRTQVLGDAAAAIVVLVIATVLSVYKPWGKIPLATDAGLQRSATGRYVLLALVALVLLAVALHLSGIGMRH